MSSGAILFIFVSVISWFFYICVMQTYITTHLIGCFRKQRKDITRRISRIMKKCTAKKSNQMTAEHDK